MAGRGHGRQSGPRTFGAAPACLLVVAAFSSLAGPTSAAAAAPYEPNDAIAAAAGPLAAGQSYEAAIEYAGDRDYYSFYVTSPEPAQVSLTVRNLGGDSGVSGVDATILDELGTPLASQTFVRDGESRLVSAQLAPQKYFVEVSASEGSGDSYLLSPGGGTGAFGPYAEIAGRCASAARASGRAGRRLGRARSRLQRTTARLRRSRYSGRRARRRAAAAPRATRRALRKRRRALRSARRARQPWCSIAP